MFKMFADIHGINTPPWLISSYQSGVVKGGPGKDAFS